MLVPGSVDLLPRTSPEAVPTSGPAALPFLAVIEAGGTRPALGHGRRIMDRSSLRRRLISTGRRLGAGQRRLVVVAAANTPRALIAHLAALREGHVVLLAPPCAADDLAHRYGADTLVDAAGIHVRSAAPQHELHPELAVLLSTSGSTGSAKLVRLSYANLAANALAIAQSLRLTEADRAVTTLSPAYSYGLSVLHSHLAVGASVQLCERSVTEPAFWREARRARATTLAGVPHTFELLDRVGFDAPAMLPSLRLLTCAGGRLPEATARRYAAAGRDAGFGLAVMYGATEATARMACLPPELALAHPGTVGRPIPGGELTVADPDNRGVGRLVYRGPNVMLGYAEAPADLARGRELDALDTGDRGRVRPDGLVEVLGRDAPFAKVFGLRVDLAEVERRLEVAGVAAVAVDQGTHLGLVVRTGGPGGPPPGCLPGLVSVATGLPPAGLRLHHVDELPRSAAGKPDRAAAAALLTPPGAPAGAGASADPTDPLAALLAAFGELLGRPVGPQDSFVGLRGDSLSYVAASVAVERILGHLPLEWHRRSLAALAAQARPGQARPAQAGPAPGAPAASPGRRIAATLRPGGWAQLDAAVVVRAVAILAVVASHAGVVDLRGGAHLLLALVGLSLARFVLPIADPAARLRTMGRSMARILLPSLAWIGGAAALAGSYTWAALGGAWLTDPTTDTPDWRYWFVAALLWLLPPIALALRVPVVEAARRRWPFGLPAAATVAAWGAALVLVPDARPAALFAPLAVLWMLLLGWTIAEARTIGRRVLASVLVLALVPTSFVESRALVIPLGLLVLLWVPRVRMPRPLAAAATSVAAVSLALYLTHWQVLDVLRGWPALLVSVGVALLADRLARGACRRLRVTAGAS